MDRYVIDGVILGEYPDNMDIVAQNEQTELLKAIDRALYEQFDIAVEQGNSEFELVLNGGELSCLLSIVGNELHYTATRTDTQKQEHYVFMVDLGEVDDSILADDITEARLVSLWAVAGYRF